MPGPKIEIPNSERLARIRVRASSDGGRVVKAAGELAEDCRTDADDNREDQDLDARGNHVAQHLLGKERRAPEKAEGHKNKAGKGREFELDECHEQLNRDGEKTQNDDQPGDKENRDLDEIRKEAGEARHAGDGRQYWFAGVDPNLGKLARLKKLALGQSSAAGLKPQAGKGVKDDLGEGIEVPDDEGEQPYI